MINSNSNECSMNSTMHKSNEKEDIQIKDLTKEPKEATTTTNHIINNRVYDTNLDRNSCFLEIDTIICNNSHPSEHRMKIINNIIINNNRKHSSNTETNTNMNVQTYIENNKTVKSKKRAENDHDKDLDYVIVCKQIKKRKDYKYKPIE